MIVVFFFSSRRRHTRYWRDWSSDVCSSDLAPVRPVTAPFAAVFGLLVAAEEVYLGWLLWDAEPGWGWYLLVPAVLAAGALTGAGLVLRGRSPGRRVSGSAVLAVFCLLPLLGLLGLSVVFAALGGGSAVWWALLLLVGPVGG